MRRLTTILLLCGLAVIASGAATSAMAKTPRPTLLYPALVDLHFADANGRVHTLAITINAEKLAAGDCAVVYEDMARPIAAQRAPELYDMTYIGSTCHGAAVPKTVSVQPKAPDARPAIVVLYFRAPDGTMHKSVLGDKHAGDYQMGSCPLILKRTKAALAKQVQADRPGQKLVDATCFIRNANSLFGFKND